MVLIVIEPQTEPQKTRSRIWSSATRSHQHLQSQLRYSLVTEISNVIVLLKGWSQGQVLTDSKHIKADLLLEWETVESGTHSAYLNL